MRNWIGPTNMGGGGLSSCSARLGDFSFHFLSIIPVGISCQIQTEWAWVVTRECYKSASPLAGTDTAARLYLCNIKESAWVRHWTFEPCVILVF